MFDEVVSKDPLMLKQGYYSSGKSEKNISFSASSEKVMASQKILKYFEKWSGKVG